MDLTALSVSTVLGILLLPAVVFALAYTPVMTHYSRGLVSHYPKADVRRRLSAAFVDVMVVTTLSVGYWIGGSPLYLSFGAAYLLLRDAVGGRSIGKLLFGLVVISLQTGRPSSFAGSIERNLLLLLPGANIVAVFLETRTIVADAQGQRLGDRLAQTQVVEGAGAMELVKSVQDWIVTLGGEFGSAAGGRRPHPGPIDRAA
jgi:uncharacterized RDD family membrane protein YckC